MTTKECYNDQCGDKTGGFILNIQVNTENLNARAAALKTAGEAFTPQQLNAIDNRSTISAVKNSIDAHTKTNLTNRSIGDYLVQSATLATDIGERFFEIDASAAAMMGAEAVK